MDDLPRVDIAPSTQCRCSVEQNDGFADSTRTGEHDETIGHRAGNNVSENVGAVAEIALSPSLEEPMRGLPRAW